MPNKKLASLIAIALFLVPYLQTSAYDAASAQTYLASQQPSPWVTMALTASGASATNTDYLKNISSAKAIDYEAPILAITSLGQDPRSFGATDYVAKLESFASSGQIDDPALLNDDFFGILALRSAGVAASDQAVSGSESFILSHQNSDGGWSWSATGTSDSNDTAAAIMALLAAGTSASDSHIQSAINYLKTLQEPDGGFTYDASGSTTDSASTSWVVWALNALGINSASWAKGNNTPVSYLQSYQLTDGSFKWEAGDTSGTPAMTAYASMALAGKFLPLKTISFVLPSASFRIEGSNSTVCSGTVNAQTALDVVKDAAIICNFTYDIKSTTYGPYLDQIAGDSASGNLGWLYMVNNTAPEIGAADYRLKTGDSVLWYFDDYNNNSQPTSLSLSAKTVASGQAATATVKAWQAGAWVPLTGATVYAGAATAVTDSNGQATLGLPDGYYQVYAQLKTYIRSNTLTLQVGQPNSSTVSLNANFSGGQVAGTSTPTQTSGISFTINANSLDFGNVGPGSKTSKTVNIQNNGNAGIRLNASVSGDPLFSDNLSVNNVFWQNYKAALNGNQAQSIPVILNIPAGFADNNGSKTGQLIFWASAQ